MHGVVTDDAKPDRFFRRTGILSGGIFIGASNITNGYAIREKRSFCITFRIGYSRAIHFAKYLSGDARWIPPRSSRRATGRRIRPMSTPSTVRP
ncbi:hypothetical protein F3J12_07025 [Burkholderia sp. Ax-1735]|nr:hypothetical protein [Burkholderia sp. Ap-955]NIF09313.1 hypothetical protein [Burkholderia sp. Ax-1735]NIG02413.1 hypothetical protein [Burkholderia sp. Tr-849]OXJ30294.1 hypothetical protein CFB82_26895 [Burkholderia sp. HI2714]